MITLKASPIRFVPPGQAVAAHACGLPVVSGSRWWCFASGERVTCGGRNVKKERVSGVDLVGCSGLSGTAWPSARKGVAAVV